MFPNGLIHDGEELPVIGFHPARSEREQKSWDAFHAYEELLIGLIDRELAKRREAKGNV